MKAGKKQRKQEREDSKIRNHIEGKFGEGKRFYGLGLVMTRLADSCETVVALRPSFDEMKDKGAVCRSSVLRPRAAP